MVPGWIPMPPTPRYFTEYNESYNPPFAWSVMAHEDDGTIRRLARTCTEEEAATILTALNVRFGATDIPEKELVEFAHHVITLAARLSADVHRTELIFSDVSDEIREAMRNRAKKMLGLLMETWRSVKETP